mmetsp:Transcript_16813/g.26818  ORF Transcript_16813/g.26818 Transcript_16813/m.26818 type:complete len:146 (+) Transcript_16813:551-988(+)
MHACVYDVHVHVHVWMFWSVRRARNMTCGVNMHFVRARARVCGNCGGVHDSKKSQHQREIGRKDRLKFKDLMTKLSGEQLSALVGNLREQCPGALSKDAEAVEVQIDRIDSATLLDQLQFCRECVKRNRQGTAYSVPASKRFKHR